MKSMALISLAISALCMFAPALGSDEHCVHTRFNHEYTFMLSPIQPNFDIDVAQKHCKTLGGDLIHSAMLQGRYFDTIKGIIENSGVNSVYIGLNDRKTEGKFRWTDGTDFKGPQMFDWLDHQPDNWWDEDCVIVQRATLRMNDYDCKNRYEGRALCQITGKPSAPSGPQEYDFKLTTLESSFDIDEAANQCKSFGGSLLHDGLLQERYVSTITALVKGAGVNKVFVGLNDREKEGVFRQVDGQPMATPFFKWNKGEPNDKNNKGEDCIHFKKNKMGFDDYKCKAKNARAICEIEKSSDSSGGGSSSHANFKFKLTPQQKLLNIDVARKSCAAMNGRLVGEALDIPEYYETIRELLFDDYVKTKNMNVYTGFNDRTREGYWVAETGKPFTNAGLYRWMKTEPNNAFNQDCSLIRTTRSELWDVRCHGQYLAKALCEIPV